MDTNNNALIDLFFKTYKEFETIDREIILTQCIKVSCLYPKYYDLYQKPLNNDCNLYYSYFMLVAHYLVVNGYASSIGINKSSGLVSSSSIDGVSVSYQTSPYNNNYDYFFSQTPYGMEYLAYLSSITSCKLIN